MLKVSTLPSPTLGDEAIRTLLRMYLPSDVAKATGIPSATLRTFINGNTQTLRSTSAKTLTDFLWSHTTLLCNAFNIDQSAQKETGEKDVAKDPANEMLDRVFEERYKPSKPRSKRVYVKKADKEA